MPYLPDNFKVVKFAGALHGLQPEKTYVWPVECPSQRVDEETAQCVAKLLLAETSAEARSLDDLI